MCGQGKKGSKDKSHPTPTTRTPSLFQWEQFATEVIQTVFVMDQLTTSHPLYVPVATVSEMEQYFDSISYEKVSLVSYCYLNTAAAI